MNDLARLQLRLKPASTGKIMTINDRLKPVVYYRWKATAMVKTLIPSGKESRTRTDQTGGSIRIFWYEQRRSRCVTCK